MNGWWVLFMGWCGVGGGVDWLTKWYGMILSLLVVSRVLLSLQRWNRCPQRLSMTGFRLFTGTYYRGLDYVQVRPAHAYILSAYPRVRRVIMLTYSVDAGALERSRIHTL